MSDSKAKDGGSELNTGSESLDGKLGKAYFSGPGFRNEIVEYTVDKEGRCVMGDGCIIIGRVGEVRTVEEGAPPIAPVRSSAATMEHGGLGDTARQSGGGFAEDSDYLWPNGIVYYTIDTDVPDQQRLRDAFAHMESNTPIRFKSRTTQANYVRIRSNGNANTSHSALGMRGGEQEMLVSDKHSWQIVVHECCHATGITHEQCRPDRNDFVDVNWDNITDKGKPNFRIGSSTKSYFDYDYGSIMHYGRRQFAIDGSIDTLTPKQSGVEIGQRERLSYTDRQTLAKMYERYFEKGYTGVWRAAEGKHALWINASWSSFTDKWTEWSGQGLRLQDIHVRRVNGRTLYSGIFLPGSGAYALWANVTWESFKEKWSEFSAQGLRLIDVHVHRVGDENRYSGVFVAGTGAHGLWVNSSWTSFKAKWSEWSGQGMRLKDLFVQRVNGENRYTGVFLAGSGAHGLWVNATWSSFLAKWQEFSANGLRLTDINIHQSGSSQRYSGVFGPGTDKYALWANVTYSSLVAKHEELAEQGLRMVDFEMPIPGDSAASADMSADAVSYAEQELETFGGLYDGQSSVIAPSQEITDGFGGLVLPESASAIPISTPELVASDNGEHGGAIFEAPNQSASLASMSANGGAFGLGGAGMTASGNGSDYGQGLGDISRH